jgi:hypothetical protein
LIGARYKGKLPHFEICIKLRIFFIAILMILKKICGHYLVNFSPFWAQKTHFRVGRHEHKEKRLLYFGFRILFLIHIQMLDIENPENPKLTHPIIQSRLYLFI